MGRGGLCDRYALLSQDRFSQPSSRNNNNNNSNNNNNNVYIDVQIMTIG